MGSFTSHALAGIIAAVATASSAFAADMLQPPPPLAPAPVAVDFGGGFYLRGDVGVGIVDVDKFVGVDTHPGFVGPPGGYQLRQKHIEDQVLIGLGVGYQFNNWLRADFTAEYRTEAAFKTVESYNYTTNPHAQGFNKVEGKFGSVVGLGNVYFDLGTFHGITPFIGAGVGFAHHRLNGVHDLGFGAAAGGIGYASDIDTTELAWAVHAGLGYQVSHNLKLELAYRYLNMGDIESGLVLCQNQPGGCPGTVYKLKEVDSHDLKIGMRWLLAEPVAAPYHEPAPLVRKY